LECKKRGFDCVRENVIQTSEMRASPGRHKYDDIIHTDADFQKEPLQAASTSRTEEQGTLMFVSSADVVRPVHRVKSPEASLSEKPCVPENAYVARLLFGTPSLNVIVFRCAASLTAIIGRQLSHCRMLCFPIVRERHARRSASVW
jgi:hypothetical protein